MTQHISVLLAGNILTQPFARISQALPEFDLDIDHAEIDQVFQVLTSAPPCDVLLLPVCSNFFLDETTETDALARIDAYCDAIVAFAERVSAHVIVNTIEQRPARIVGKRHLQDLLLLAELDRRIIKLADRSAFVSVVDIGGIVAEIGSANALRQQNRLAMQMPFSKVAIDAIIGAYAQAIRERRVARKKVIVLDADNTLWGGIVGEDGVDGVLIDRQYPGSVYRRFQTQLRDLSETGVLLAMVSKNNRADVEEVFDRREMPLTLDHFSAIRINWDPKSKNVLAIAEELNLGIDSLVFIDDNPFELEQVRIGAPGIEVYRFEAGRVDQALGLLASIDGLKTWSVNSDDEAKADQYRQERRRSEARGQAVSLDDYLASLNMQLEIGRNRRSQIVRITQLTNKTNQFNLTTRRYSEADIVRFMETGDVFDIRLQDRFGDMGVVSVVIVADGEIDTFLMSCRALGRGAEALILKYVCAEVGGALTARYIPTNKNAMTADFFDANGFECIAVQPDGAKQYRLAAGPQFQHEIPVYEVA